jgi:hypothetical protein
MRRTAAFENTVAAIGDTETSIRAHFFVFPSLAAPALLHLGTLKTHHSGPNAAGTMLNALFEPFFFLSTLISPRLE